MQHEGCNTKMVRILGIHRIYRGKKMPLCLFIKFKVCTAAFDWRPSIMAWKPDGRGFISQAPLRFLGITLRFQKYPRVVSDML